MKLVADLYNYILESAEVEIKGVPDSIIKSDMKLYQEEYIYCKNYMIHSYLSKYEFELASDIVDIYFRLFNEMIASPRVSSENRDKIMCRIRNESISMGKYAGLISISSSNIFKLASDYYGILPDELIEYKDIIKKLSESYSDKIIIKSIAEVIEEIKPNHIINKLKLKS